MSIKTISLHGSPYVGIFCSVTDEIALIPSFIDKKEAKRIEETLNVETIQTTIANSHLIGALSRGLKKKFAVAHTIDKLEKEHLEKIGIKIHQTRNITAIGNLLAMHANGGIASPLIHPLEVQALEEFFNVKIHTKTIASSEIVGSSILATDKGFLAHPRTEPNDMEWLESVFRVPGMTTTANYGDPFIANSILANAHGAIVGERTSGPELSRIDEGLHPGLLNE